MAGPEPASRSNDGEAEKAAWTSGSSTESPNTHAIQKSRKIMIIITREELLTTYGETRFREIWFILLCTASLEPKALLPGPVITSYHSSGERIPEAPGKAPSRCCCPLGPLAECKGIILQGMMPSADSKSQPGPVIDHNFHMLQRRLAVPGGVARANSQV